MIGVIMERNFPEERRFEQVEDLDTRFILKTAVAPALEAMGQPEELNERLWDIYDHSIGRNEYLKTSSMVNQFYTELRKGMAGDRPEQILRGSAGLPFEGVDLGKKYVMRIKFDKVKEQHKKYGIGVLNMREDEEGNKSRHITEIQVLRAPGDAIVDEDNPFSVYEYATGVHIAERKHDISYKDWLMIKEQNLALKPGVKIAVLGTVAIGTAISVIAARNLRN